MSKPKNKLIEIKVDKDFGNLLYTIAIVLLTVWAIGFIAFNAGAIIHVLLVIGIVIIVLRVMNGRKKVDIK